MRKSSFLSYITLDDLPIQLGSIFRTDYQMASQRLILQISCREMINGIGNFSLPVGRFSLYCVLR
jgi:hypothetical protein